MNSTKQEKPKLVNPNYKVKGIKVKGIKITKQTVIIEY